MEKLPLHGRVNCTKCFKACDSVRFDTTKRTENDWRITANPLAWGNEDPEIIVLGFSKGPTQAGALASADHDEVAYKGSRTNVGKILKHVGLLNQSAGEDLSELVSRLIANRTGRFHFGSLIRCTVERNANGAWKGSGGGMLDKFIAKPFGQEVSNNCTERFLKNPSKRTKLILMFGMGTKLNYIHESFNLYKKVRGGSWKWINEVSYTDGKVTVVHVEHFASQGALIPQWLGERDHERRLYGIAAAKAVELALN